LRVERGIDGGAKRVERLEVIDEQAHLPAMFRYKLAREAPADAYVAEIVDHRAEDVARNVAPRVLGDTGTIRYSFR